MEYFSKNVNSIIQEVKIQNNIIESGKDIRIHFKLKSQMQGRSNLHIGVYNLSDEKILHISSEYFNEGYLKENHSNPTCEINRNPLIEGFYYLNVSIVNEGNVIERLKECLIFEVINGDFFDTGKILQPSALSAKALAVYEWC